MSRRTDIISGLVLAVFALIVLVAVIPEHTSPPQSVNNLSPAFLPSVAVLVMLVLACLLAFASWLRTPRDEDELHEEFGAEARGLGWHELGDVTVWMLFAAAMMAGFMTIGFLPTAISALALMMVYAHQRNVVAIGIVAVAVPVALQQIAWHAFSVQLP